MSNDTQAQLQHLQEENSRLNALCQTLGEALLEKTQQDDERYQALTRSMASLSQGIQEVVENMNVAPKVSREVAAFVGQQIENLFKDPILLDGIAMALLHRQLGALNERAAKSKQRQPQLRLVKYYIPGVVRLKLSEMGELNIEEQLAEASGEHDGWVVAQELMANQQTVDSFRTMMASEGLDADTYYYLTDDITLQNMQEEARQKLIDQQIAHEEREAALRQQEQAPIGQPQPTDLTEAMASAQEQPAEEPAPFDAPAGGVNGTDLSLPPLKTNPEEQSSIKAIDRLAGMLRK